MKKIIIMAVLGLIFALNGNAQNKKAYTLTSTSYGLATDTISNANTIYFKTAEGATAANKTGKYSISWLFTKNSGTCTFNAVLQGSYDGTNWFRMTGCQGTDGINCDTIAVSNQTGTIAYKFSTWPGGLKYLPSATYTQTVWTSGAMPVPYLRIAFIGTGSQSSIISNVKLSFAE